MATRRTGARHNANRPDAGRALALSADCTTRNAAALKSSLLGQLEVPEPVVVDISAVERIDTLSLQLLAAFVQERREQARLVSWRGRSDTFDQAAALLGLTATLGTSSVA